MKNTNYKKGFTLIEILVSVAIFSIVLVASMSAILSVLDANRKAQTVVTSMNELNFALDSMTRTIKTGIDHQNPAWASGDKSALYTKANDLLGLSGTFNRESVNYALHEGQIMRCINPVLTAPCGDPEANIEDWEPMTSPKINIDLLEFDILTGDGDQFNVGEDFKAPRILVKVRGSVSARADIISSFNLQTTISQRDLNLAGSEL